MSDVNVPTGYKSTDLGVIPEDWEVDRLGEKTIKIGSGITPTGGEKVYKKEGRPFLRSQNIAWGYLSLDDIAFIDDEIHNTFKATEIKNFDVFLNITGASIGRSAIADSRVENGNVNQHVCILRTNQKELNPFFLNHYLLSYKGQKQIDSFQAGGNREGLNFGQIKSFKIPLPPLPEQKAIARVLSDVDDLIRECDSLLAKKHDIKQGTMQQLLTGKKRLPGFSGEWEVKKLGDIVNRIVGGGTPRREKKEFWNGNIFWATVKDFSSFNPYRTEETITKEGLNSSSSNLIPQKTLITSTRMAVGKAVLYQVDVAINQDLKAIFQISNIDTKFLFYWFEYNASNIEKIASGSTVKGISIPELKNINFCYFCIKEQKAIAEILSDMDAEIEALEQKRDKYKAIKQGMMQELLTGKTRLIEN